MKIFLPPFLDVPLIISYESLEKKIPRKEELTDNEFSADEVMGFSWFIIGLRSGHYRGRYIRITLISGEIYRYYTAFFLSILQISL